MNAGLPCAVGLHQYPLEPQPVTSTRRSLIRSYDPLEPRPVESTRCGRRLMRVQANTSWQPQADPVSTWKFHGIVFIFAVANYIWIERFKNSQHPGHPHCRHLDGFQILRCLGFWLRESWHLADS